MLQKIKESILIKPMRKKLYEQKFKVLDNVHLFKGVFDSFEMAIQDIPPAQNTGYNNQESAQLYTERTLGIYSTDYPVLFWMEKLKSEIKTVFDFGGHIGVSFYGYSKLLDYSPIKTWTVCDVPFVIEKGQKLARKKNEKKLIFVTEFSACNGIDLFLANGSLQFLDWELHLKLKELKHLPKLIIINMTPLHLNKSTITLHNMGTSFCPYYIRDEVAFFTGLKEIGYEVLDQWINPEKSCNIPFEKDRSLNYYSGAILRLK